MGLFFNKLQENISDSILPVAAKQEIMCSRLPQINTSKIFLKRGEYCVYIDKAILNVEETKKLYKHAGGSAPGLFKGTRINTGRGWTKDYTEIKQYKGILYITNKRTIFQANEKGFEKNNSTLSAIDPYSNAVILQFGQKTFHLVVPDGSIVNHVYKLVCQ